MCGIPISPVTPPLGGSLSSFFAQRRHLGHEGPLVRPEPDDDLPVAGLDDLPDPKLGVPDPLPRAVGDPGGRRLTEPSRALPERGHPPAAASRAGPHGHAARLVLVRYLREEARGHPVLALAPIGPELGVRERERLPRPRDADVGEPALLLEVLLIERAGVREGPLLHPDDEHVVELEPLRVVERHEGDAPPLGGDGVLLRVERLLLQEAVEGRLGLDALVLAGGVYELLEVLQARLALYRVLVAQLPAVPRLVEDGPYKLGRRHLPCGHPPPLEKLPQGRAGLRRLPREPGLGGLRERLVEGDAAAAGVVLELRDGGVAEAALRDVYYELQADRICGVRDHGEVGHGVLDLGPLVEPDAAHNLVRDPLPHEHVLQSPALRVGPVERRDLARRLPPPRQLLYLRNHEPRLRVLVGGREHPDALALPSGRPQLLRLPGRVVRHHRVRRVEYRLRRAVVLLQLHHLRLRVVPLEVQDVPDVRPAPAIDRLIVIADDTKVAMRGG